MSPATRRNLLWTTIILVLVSLVFRRGFYAVDRLALELRYFWWVVVIIVGGIWLLMAIGKATK